MTSHCIIWSFVWNLGHSLDVLVEFGWVMKSICHYYIIVSRPWIISFWIKVRVTSINMCLFTYGNQSSDGSLLMFVT